MSDSSHLVTDGPRVFTGAITGLAYVPAMLEPGTFALMALGGLVAFARRRVVRSRAA